MTWRQRGVWGVTAGGVALLAWLVSAPAPAPLQAGHAPLDLGRPPKPVRVIPTQPPPTAGGTRTRAHDDAVQPAQMSDLTAMLWTIGAIVIMVTAVALLLWAGYRALKTMREEQRVTEAEVDALPEVPEALVQSPEVFHATLAQGEARNAIVACWARLEDATAQAGVPMAPHETSSEYTERVVTAWVTDDTALRRLAALYREARFSQHPMGEDSRKAAGHALDLMLADLRRTWEVRRAAAEG